MLHIESDDTDEMMPPSSEHNAIANTLCSDLCSAFERYNALHENTKCILVVDPALRNPLMLGPFVDYLAASQTDAPQRLRWHHQTLDPDHRPYLIQLDPAKASDCQVLKESLLLALDDWQFSSQAQAGGHRICGWLFTNTTVQDVALQMGHSAVQRPLLDDNTRKAQLLRFYDPAILPELWKIFKPSQRDALLGQVAQWWQMTPEAALHCYSRTVAPLDHQQIALDFESHQWRAVQQIGALNQVIFRHRMNNGAASAMTIDEPQRETIRQALQRAHEYGISNPQDLIAFGLHALNVHPQFDRHARVQQALKQLARHTYYAAAVADISPEEWQAIPVDIDNPDAASRVAP